MLANEACFGHAPFAPRFAQSRTFHSRACGGFLAEDLNFSISPVSFLSLIRGSSITMLFDRLLSWIDRHILRVQAFFISRGPKPTGYLRITDSRTSRQYELSIHDNVVDATSSMQIRTSDQAGLRVLDQGFRNTTVMESKTTHVDGIKGKNSLQRLLDIRSGGKENNSRRLRSCLFGDTCLHRLRGKTTKSSSLQKRLPLWLYGMFYEHSHRRHLR